MSNIVISGINICEGGTLSIYKELLNNLIENNYTKTNQIVAFVHDKEMFKEYEENINIIEIKKSKKSWFYRLWYEYIFFYFWSKKKDIDVWISIHDITPNVRAKKRYVYCHNTTPFIKNNKKIFKYDKKIFLFTMFYKYLYKFNINKNDAVIVQQNWIKKEFEKMYHIKNVIVARPDVKITNIKPQKQNSDNGKFKFIYASFPRVFKNFDIICEACDILSRRQIKQYEVILTMDGSENLYSKDIVEKYKENSNIKFIGLQKQDKLFELYLNSNCMIFPSKLESWGLPITEFKETKKTIILADLPYAHETIGDYDKTVFFNPDDANELAEKMIKEMTNNSNYQKNDYKIEQEIKNWKELLERII